MKYLLLLFHPRVLGIFAASGLLTSTSPQASLFADSSGSGEFLRWGTEGTGGSGVWDSETPNWWDGAGNISWQPGARAQFSGPGGLVEISGNQSVREIHFQGGGYRLTGDWLVPPEGELLVTADADGRLDATGGSNIGNLSFRKRGPGVVTLGGTQLTPHDVLLDEGELRLAGGFWSTGLFTLSEEAETVLSIAGEPGERAQIGGLAGNGLVRPAIGSGDMALVFRSSGSFRGVLSDGDSGVLSVAKWFSGTQELLGKNTWTGRTEITGGTFSLVGGGTVASTDIDLRRGRLLLDNSDEAVAGRLPGGASVTMHNGHFHFLGHPDMPVSERLDNLSLSGVSTIQAETAGSGSVELTIDRMERHPLGIARFEGDGLVQIVDPPESELLAWGFFNGWDWATIDSEGFPRSFDEFVFEMETASSQDAVSLSGGVIPVAKSRAIAALRLGHQVESGATEIEIAPEKTLSLTRGGLWAGSGGVELRGGSVTSTWDGGAGNEFIVYSDGPLALRSAFVDGGAPSHLLKLGPGRLELSGENSYSGDTVLLDGTLAFDSEAALGVGGSIHIHDGSLEVGGSITSFMDVTIHGGIPRIDVKEGTAVFGRLENTDFRRLIRKEGPGTLEFQVPGSNTGDLRVLDGTVRIHEINSGSIDLRRGRAEITGNPTEVRFRPSHGSMPVLALDGEAPQVLTVSRFDAWAGFSHPVAGEWEWRPADAGGDFISVTGLASASDPIYLRPAISSGVRLDEPYPLMEWAEFTRLEPWFQLPPDLVDAGWEAEFYNEGNTAYVIFCATPETPPLPLRDALAAPRLEWATGAEHPWQGKRCGQRLDGPAVTSGPPNPNGDSWIETSVHGPGRLSFRWRADTWDRIILRRTIGEETTDSVVLGQQEWQEWWWPIPEGKNTVRWTVLPWGYDPNRWAHERFWMADVRFVPTSLDAWRAWHEVEGKFTDPRGDPGDTGIPLLTRYALGMDPWKPERDSLPRVHLAEEAEESWIAFSFRRPRFLEDIDYRLVSSTDLQNWNPVDSETVQVSIDSDAPDWEWVTVRDPVDTAGNVSSKFFRLSIILSE